MARSTTELPWKLVCPGCGRLMSIALRVMANYDYKCPAPCQNHISDYVREAV